MRSPEAMAVFEELEQILMLSCHGFAPPNAKYPEGGHPQFEVSLLSEKAFRVTQTFTLWREGNKGNYSYFASQPYPSDMGFMREADNKYRLMI